MEEDGERHTLSLVMELKQLCQEAADAQDNFAARFHDLLRQVSNPNMMTVERDLTFRVIGHAGRTNNILRTISLNGNATVGRAAYEAAVKLYPNDRWVLTWGALLIEDSMPRKPGEEFSL
jgi:hypothetical protein